MALALRGLTRCRRQVAFVLDLDELLLHQGQPLDFPRDLPAETFRQGVAVARDQIGRRKVL